MGLGHFEGNIENYKLTPEIYQTTDIKTWTTLSKKSNLPIRFFYHPFVFNNMIKYGGMPDLPKFIHNNDVWEMEDK